MNLSHFDLNLLKALDVLLEEKNVTRAGERLFITQQAASSALHRLRQQFNDVLLVRIGRHFELTPLGRSLVQPVRDTLLAAQRALDTMPVFDPALASRYFSIAMTDYSIQVFLPEFTRKLTAAAPGIRLNVKPFNRESFNRIDAGQLDFCITANDWHLYGEKAPKPNILSTKLFRDDFVCVVDKNFQTSGQILDLELYGKLSHNSVDFGLGIATIVEQAWTKHDLKIDVTVTVPSFSALVSVLPGTHLVATTQRRLAEMLAPNLGLKVVECPLDIPQLQESLFWHSRNDADPTSRFVIETIKEASRELELRIPAKSLTPMTNGPETE